MVMETQGSHYHFGEGAGNNPMLPVSAFSAYSLLRNCNYLITSQTQDRHLKPIRSISTDFHIRSPLPENPENSFLNCPTQAFLSPPTALFGYPHHIHILPNEPTNTRGEKKPIPDEQKDDKYFERRRRNNQAAKKSRDARKMREDQ
ncbi:hypothetical protein NQ318_014660, partial [Aromia moschata]